MHTNYNTLTLPISNNGKYNIGDIYNKKTASTKINRFIGLEIKRISYNFGVVLHFDYNEWFYNHKNKQKTMLTGKAKEGFDRWFEKHNCNEKKINKLNINFY